MSSAGVLVTGHNSGHFLLLPRGDAVQEGGLALLSSLLHNKDLVKDNLEEVELLVVEQLFPSLTQELEKLKDMMGKVKPKYL